MAEGTNINLLCYELEKLLHDICAYLNEESIDSILPLSKKLKAGLLLKRSHQQLRTVRDINKPPQETHPIISCSRVLDRSQDQESIYANVSDLRDLSNSIFEEPDFPNVYEDDVVNGKSGHLLFHQKIFFFGKTKKVFVAIFRHWCIIYANESTSKPRNVINLTQYKCSPCADLPSNVKKKEKSFDVIPIDGSKYFRFTASSPKEMSQWVTAINNSSQNQNPSPVPTLTDTRPDNVLKDGPNFKITAKVELKENNIPTMQQSPHGYQLHEAAPSPFFANMDRNKYISVIGSGSIDSFSTDENDKVYDTLERVKKHAK